MKPKSLSNRFIPRASSLLGALVLCHFTPAASAATFVWDGGGATLNMNNGANWNPDGLPAAVAGDIGQFDGTVAGNLVVGTNGPSAATNPWTVHVTAGQDSSLTIDTPSGGNGMRVYNVLIDAGAFESAGAAFSFGNGTGTPILNLGSGVEPYLNNSFTNNSAATALIQSDIRFANGSTLSRILTFDGTGGWTVTAPLGVTSGTNGSIGVIKSGGGALTLNGANTFTDGLVLNEGRLNINTATALGAAASTFTIAGGSLDNTSGAAKTISANNPQIWNADIAFGTGDGTVLNDLSLGAGTVSLGTTAGTSRTVNTAGLGTLTVAGVVSDGTTANSLIKTGSGALKLDGNNTFTGGITLVTGALHVTNNNALGTGTLTVNGGSIIPRVASRTVSNPVSVGGNFTIGAATVGNQLTFSGLVNLGGATRTITVEDTTQNLDATFSGVISNGGFTKSGAGTLVFSGAHTYVGPTTVTQGTLSLTNSAPLDFSSSVTINGTGAKLALNTGGTLAQPVTLTLGTIDGYGTINSLTVADSIDNIVNAGGGSLAALTVGSLTFQGAASLNLNNSGPFFAQQLYVTNLVTSASAKVVVTATSDTGVWADNTDYPLIEFATYAQADASHFTLVTPLGLNPSQRATLVKTAGAIVLRITTDAILWTGASNANWTAAPVAGVSNWTPSEFATGKAVIFEDAAQNLNVNLAANVSPSSTIFNNDLYDYTLSSTGAFGISTGSLTKNGSAKLTVSTTNTFPGPTVINGGILEFGAPFTNTPSIAINNASSLVLEVATAYGYGNPITGNGSVTKNGAAALTLSGVNTFTGNVILNAGNLNINAPSALGAGAGAIVINGGSFDNSSGAAIVTAANKPQTWNSDVTFIGSNNLDLGTGTVTLGGEGSPTVIPGGSGDILIVGEIKSVTQGLTLTGGGTLVATSTGSFGDASRIGGTLTVAGGTTLQINRSTADSSATTGDFVATGLAGTGTIVSGALASERSLQINTTENQTFGGTIANGGAAALALNKQGVGTLTLTGASTYTGPTVIGGGILDVRNANALGSSRVSIVSRLGGMQIQGGITLPSAVTFLTSNDGLNAGAIGYAIASVSGDNVINGAITMTSGGGFTIIQSDNGTLKLNGNVSSDQARSLILHGTSTGANSLNGILSNGTAGTNGLTKTGTGTWLVTAANTYTGVTTISEGTLQLGNGTSDGTIATTSSVVNNAALVYHWVTDHTAAYVISGTGSVTKDGAGIATFTGVNTYTGPTTINAGELAVNGSSIADSGTVVINGGKVNLTGSETVDKLFFGGVQQPAGNYTSAGDGVHFSGSGTLIVTSGPGSSSGFSNWATVNGATGQTAGDDHDGDGVSNGIEFFVGGGTGFTALPSVVNNAAVKTVTWPKSASYTGTYQVQVSTDLLVWTAAPVGTVVDNGTTVVFTFPAGPSTRFVRLDVTPN